MTYDAIVIGVGGVGSAAMCELARRGLQVLGIEQFDVLHKRGSSHGHTRVIRQAYFEHPDYVPLLLEAYRLWRELEHLSGTPLLHTIGLVEFGPPEGEVISGVLKAAELHDLAVETFSETEARQRFPFLLVPDGCVAVFEPAAGYLLVEQCVQAHVEAALVHGAHLAPAEPVMSWSVEKGQVTVTTTKRNYTAARLVICAGAWSSQLAPWLPLDVRLKHVHWLADVENALGPERCPVFLYEWTDGVFYGFPNIQEQGIKLAEHSGGTIVKNPSDVSGEIDPHDLQRVSEFAKSCLRNISTSMSRHQTCFYTMSPDGHFIVDRLNDAPPVACAAGLSGHGFKFAPVIGKALADLVTSGGTDLPIDFLNLNRSSNAAAGNGDGAAGQ